MLQDERFTVPQPPLQDDDHARSTGDEPVRSVPLPNEVVELAAWLSPSRSFQQKPPTWYLGLFAVGLIAVILFALLQEWLLILLTAAGVFVFYALARVEPVQVEHRLLNTGVESAGRLYPWKDLKSFWVQDKPGETLLRLDTKLYFPHVLELLLPDDVERDEVQDIILPYLPLQERAAAQTGAMADNAIMSLANKLPYRDRMLKWLKDRAAI